MFSPYRTTTTELPALPLHPPHHPNPHSRCWCHPWPLSPQTKATLRWRMWVVVPGSPSPHQRWPHPRKLTTTASPGVSVTLYTTMATWSAVTSAGKMINDQEKLGYMHVTHVHVKDVGLFMFVDLFVCLPVFIWKGGCKEYDIKFKHLLDLFCFPVCFWVFLMYDKCLTVLKRLNFYCTLLIDWSIEFSVKEFIIVILW